ncbi:Cytosolic carboxypeptidase 1 [Hondaea fermentalgiana]|uniref:tubulin-glutamate carboxypeptidase n=1 Tax=Hondaea fermentalgiana TaxID=2315210 RepID=A0A2R5G051_9STRA|nr:Cytosolic carboxypeptidase 1 [Hondaea fermentalgiana]|eukprot:GBG24370.1 Cytosolic carboxypeptidase 1 [Hondaea fermentalgiana]
MNFRAAGGGGGANGATATSSNNVYGNKAVAILTKLHTLAANRTDGVTEDDARNCQECLANLCVLARKPAAKAIILKSICTLLLNAFRRYRAYPSTLQGACDLAWSLAYHDDVTQGVFAESGITVAVIECALHHESLLNILRSAYGALSSLCRHPANQGLARKHGMLDLVHRTLQRDHSQDPVLVQYTLDCAASICHAHKDNGNHFLAYDGAKHVVSALEALIQHQGVVRSACIVLVVLRDRAGGPKAVASTGCVPVLTSAINKHTTVPELEHILCALLGQLMREVPSTIPEALSAGAIGASLAAMKANPGHYFIVEAGCMILGACCSLILRRSGQDRAHRGGSFGRRRSRNKVSDADEADKETNAAAEELEIAVDGVGWAGIAAVLQSTDAKPSAYVSCLRVLVQFCQISKGKGQALQRVHDLLPRVFVVCGALSGPLAPQGLGIMETLLLSDAVDVLAASADVMNLIDRDVTWSELLGFAMTWMREARCVSELRLNVGENGDPSMEDALLVIVAALQFIVCTLLKERQLTLRCMASNGGVTLVLQMQKLVKSLEEIERQGGRLVRLQCMALDATAAILRLIGSGTTPNANGLPEQDDLLQHFNDAAAIEARDLRSLEIRAQEGKTELAEDEDTNDRAGVNAPEYDTDEADHLEKGSNNRRSVTGSEQEENKKNRAALDRDDGADDGDDDGSDADEGDANDDSDADDSDADEGVSGEVVTRLEASENAGADMLAGKTASQTVKKASKAGAEQRLRASGFRLEAFVPGQESERAPANFVAVLPKLVHDLTDDDLEPCIPIGQRLNPTAAQTLSKLGEYQSRKLVYDWRQSLGEGDGRARSSVPMAVPYSVGTEEALQTNEPSILLPSGPSLSRTSSSGLHDHFLRFESRFEGGNLLQANRVGPREYDLVIRSDLHTRSHHQWFYFAVSNTHAADASGSVQYKFNIVNMTKPSSMFGEGMQPVMYSMKEAKEGQGKGWRRAGKNIAYFANSYATPPSLQKKSTSANYYTLTFTLTFPNPDDVYYVAMCYPYTYSHLQEFLDTLCVSGKKDKKSPIFRRGVLCTTLGGLPCDELTITDFTASPAEIAARPAVVLTARVHPGEVVASYMIEGTIRFLLGTSALACALRRLYYFKIVPMLNPDGVYHGNSRTSLSGCDLNRAWIAPNPNVFPTIYHTKQLIRRLIAQRKVSLYVDFHGHSRKKNIFLYGVEYKKASARPRDEIAHDMSNPVRAFPKLMSESEYSSDIFSLPDCSYTVSKSHAQAARVVVARELGVRASFTLEASFCGGASGTLDARLDDQHFNPEHYRRIGLGLSDALLRMNHPKVHAALRQLCGSAPIALTSAPPTLLEELLERTLGKARSAVPGTGASFEYSGAGAHAEAVSGGSRKGEAKKVQAESQGHFIIGDFKFIVIVVPISEFYAHLIVFKRCKTWS